MRRRLFFIFLLALSCLVAYAQPQNGNNNHHHFDRDAYNARIQAEKVAYFTTTLDLTVEEAQKFWPVYNAYIKDIEDAHNQAAKALMALKKKDAKDAELEKAIADYGKALAKEGELTNKYSKEFIDILPVAKVAKVFTIENDFRMMLLNRLRGDKR